MPRLLADLLYNGSLEEHHVLGRPQRVHWSKASSFMIGEDEASIDDSPDQELWPLPVPGMRKKDPFSEIESFLTGHPKKAEDETFGKEAKELEPSVRWSHEEANKADEYAVEAQEAAEDAVRWDRGIVRAVGVAEEAWDGAAYAKKVNSNLEQLSEDLDGVVKDRSKISTEINELGEQVDRVINPKSGMHPGSCNPKIVSMDVDFETAGKHIRPFQDKKLKPFMEFLEIKDHPPLFPPQDGPGMKDGHVEVPLHFPEDPDPQIMEEYTAPDVQARMPPGTLPLDMSSLKAVA